MPITETQKAKRIDHIGSSDMAAILGANPWKSAYDVWLEKTGKATVEIDSEAAGIGLDMETGVLRFAERELGPLTRNQYRSNPDLHLGANIDAIVNQTQEPVEAKVSGILKPLYGDWGEFGTDQVPDQYIIQCHVHMLCLVKNSPALCHLAALLGGRGRGIFKIQRNDELIKMIGEAAVEFWQKNVLQDTPPETSWPHLDVLKTVRRQPKKIISLPISLDPWLTAKKVLDGAEKLEQDERAKVLTALGDAEGGVTDAGLGVTFLEQTRKGFDAQALRAEHPLMYDIYATQTTYRVLRVKKNMSLEETSNG